MDPRHILFLIVINVVGGVSPILLKPAFGEMPPLFLVSLRFVFLSALLLPFTRWHAGQMGRLLSAAFFAGSLQFGLFMLAIARGGDVSPITIATQLNAPFAVLLSVIFLKEKVHWRRWTGLALALSGGLIIAFDPRVFAYIGAFSMAALAALSAAASAILMRGLKKVSTFEFLAWVAHSSWPVLLLLSWVGETGQFASITHSSALPWLAIVYTSLASSILFHGGYYFMVQRYEISRVSPFLLISPPTTVLLGVLVLGDVLTPRIIIGSLVTLSGVGVILVRDRNIPIERVAT